MSSEKVDLNQTFANNPNMNKFLRIFNYVGLTASSVGGWVSVSWLSHGTAIARFIEIFGFLTAADLQKVVVDLHKSRIWQYPIFKR